MTTLRLKEQTVRVAAPRALVFEVVAAAGKKVGDTDGGKLVEFETRWRDRVFKTTEALELEAPRRIGYRWVEGPVDGVEEEIRFEDARPGVTDMTYSGRMQSAPGLIGWLRTVMFVRPIFNKLVSDHLEEGRRVAEERSRRSHVHPRTRRP